MNWTWTQLKNVQATSFTSAVSTKDHIKYIQLATIKYKQHLPVARRREAPNETGITVIKHSLDKIAKENITETT